MDFINCRGDVLCVEALGKSLCYTVTPTLRHVIHCFSFSYVSGGIVACTETAKANGGGGGGEFYHVTGHFAAC